MLFLDRCLFNSNVAAGIIAHTREDAEHIFKRIKYAYDNLPAEIKKARPAKTDSARELVFSNNSSIRVGTSMRGSTLQYLHISEFGKICAKYPDKAEEIITGSLNTVAPGQYVFIESTAEGREGYFYDMCKRAQQMQGKELTKIDYKFHFFPWWKESTYRLGSAPHITEDQHTYFNHLASIGIHLDPEQKYWYAAMEPIQKDNMKREYPSTPEESWEISNEGLYYGKLVAIARSEKRIGNVPHDPALEVHTAWDLGYNDSTSIWFFQIAGKEIHLIEYIEGEGESLTHWLQVVKSKPYTYGKHLAPHDIQAHEYSTGTTRISTARKLGVSMIAVPRHEIVTGIDALRNIFPRLWIDEKKCAQGIKCLEGYKKAWDDRRGCWLSSPLHNWASHGADAARTLAVGLNYVTNTMTQAQREKEKLEALRDEAGLLPGHYLYTQQPTNQINHNRGRVF